MQKHQAKQAKIVRSDAPKQVFGQHGISRSAEAEFRLPNRSFHESLHGHRLGWMGKQPPGPDGLDGGLALLRQKVPEKPGILGSVPG